MIGRATALLALAGSAVAFSPMVRRGRVCACMRAKDWSGGGANITEYPGPR